MIIPDELTIEKMNALVAEDMQTNETLPTKLSESAAMYLKAQMEAGADTYPYYSVAGVGNVWCEDGQRREIGEYNVWVEKNLAKRINS